MGCLLFLNGCGRHFIASSSGDPVPSGKSIKVITSMPNDILAGYLERSLMQAGYRVISDNIATDNRPTAYTSYEEIDSSLAVIQESYGPRERVLFPDRASDYILRYTEESSGGMLLRLGIKIIDPQTGEIVHLFNYERASLRVYSYEEIFNQFKARLTGDGKII